ncbi:substrate-binding domain-containing protein [Actinacidiphila glaucinigra]|uniref:ABC-type phosphate transport system, substrate-binding protein n=1 Tax=Actinacidiphila glaucinigra TaxID=235986 RepID=A0A239CLS1_9ACTN|nr:substrate-binding domain-containing protein [Actinacidiphila glaucinigra]SNS21060.1 ABC-type phosphate transport system, substrate-binding protein [Actinacidiphila glaucinigra]
MFDTIADFFGGLSDGQMWAGAVVCAVSASVVAFWLDRYQGWRRISWSEVYNGPINKHINSQPPPGMWEIHWQGQQISEGSLVILEVRNSGVQTLEPEHFPGPLTFTFEGRKVVHFKVRDANETLETALRPQVPAQAAPVPADTHPAGAHPSGSGSVSGSASVSTVRQSAGEGTEQRTDTITLPLFTLNRRDRFRLLVLLEDGRNGSSVKPPKITAGGKVRGGRIKRTAGRARRRWAAAIVVTLVAALSLGAGTYANNRSLALNATCSSSRLTVAGSTAFSPLAHQVKESYEERCTEAEVLLEATGSREGLTKLRANRTDETIAMVDTVPGLAPEKGLDGHHVGVLVFAVVANEKLSRDRSLWDRGLTQEELRQVFTGGAVDDEDERLAGAPVAVVRADGSGTRDVFEERVLGTRPTTPASPCPVPRRDSDGAGGEGPAEAPRICSVGSTMELLDYVNRTENAVGYAEADALPFFPHVRTVPVNGTAPTKEDVLAGDYPFWASEVLYTREGATGITRDFLDFLRSRGVSKLLEGRGFLPCRELEDSRVEAMRCGAG